MNGDDTDTRKRVTPEVARWPSATQYVRVTPTEIEVWASTDSHRRDRGYKP
jgi:hypothetical protein